MRKAKSGKRNSPPNKKNKYAKDLRTPKYKLRVIPDKRLSKKDKVLFCEIVKYVELALNGDIDG